MTERLNGVWVAFERDIREDDAQAIIDAIGCIRGVLKVEANVTNANNWIAQTRVRQELGEKLWEILYPKDKT